MAALSSAQVLRQINSSGSVPRNIIILLQSSLQQAHCNKLRR